MKGLKVAALAAIGLLLASTGFAADYAAPHLVTKELRFRTHVAATVAPADFMGGYVDSAATYRLGTQIMPLDSSAAFTTLNWVFPQNQALSDTSGFVCAINVFDATGSACASTADSLYIAVQGSLNGANWATLNTGKAGTISSITSRIDQTAGGPFQGLLSANGASQAGGTGSMWHYVIKQRAAQGYDGRDLAAAGTWPLLRVIVGFPDAVKYGVSATVTYVSTRDE